MNTDVLTLKLERKLWACNAWRMSKTGNVYQYSDRYQTSVNIHKRRSGRWGIGELGSLTRSATWGPEYTFIETAVWKSFEWLYRTLPIHIDDDLYIKFKLLDSLKNAYERPGFTMFGILDGAEFNLEKLRNRVKWVNLVAEHRAVRGQCREYSPEYHRRVKDKWSPKPSKQDPDKADEVVDAQNGSSESLPVDEEMRPQYDVIKHKKTYTEDAPLFGKLVGTFTWREYKRREPKNEEQS